MEQPLCLLSRPKRSAFPLAALSSFLFLLSLFLDYSIFILSIKIDSNHTATSLAQEDQIQAKKPVFNHAHLKKVAFPLGSRQQADQAKRRAISSFIFNVSASEPAPGASPEEEEDQWWAGLA